MFEGRRRRGRYFWSCLGLSDTGVERGVRMWRAGAGAGAGERHGDVGEDGRVGLELRIVDEELRLRGLVGGDVVG